MSALRRRLGVTAASDARDEGLHDRPKTLDEDDKDASVSILSEDAVVVVSSWRIESLFCSHNVASVLSVVALFVA
jgi:hypothetical protein